MTDEETGSTLTSPVGNSKKEGEDKLSLPPAPAAPSKGDFLTQASAVREFLTMCFNTFYLIAGILDTALPSTFKKTPLGSTLPSAIVGIPLAAFIAYGAAEIQKELDASNEKPRETITKEALPTETKEEALHDYDMNTLLGKCLYLITDAGKLKLWHSAKIGLAWAGQTGDLVGFSIGMLSAGNSSLTKIEKLAVYFVIMAVGAGGSYAAIRPSSNTIKFNEGTGRNVGYNEPNPNQYPDKWTLLFLFVKIFQTLISSMTCYGMMADRDNNYKPNTPFGVSAEGIEETFPYIMGVTLAVVFFQYCISVTRQKLYRDRAPVSVTTTEIPESVLEKGIIYTGLLGRMIGTGTDVAVPLLVILNNVVSNKLYTPIALAGITAGTIASASDGRTSRKHQIELRTSNGPDYGLKKGAIALTKWVSVSTRNAYDKVSQCCTREGDLKQQLLS